MTHPATPPDDSMDFGPTRRPEGSGQPNPPAPEPKSNPEAAPDDLDFGQTMIGFQPGQRFFGSRYRLVRQLGRGGMGVVWLAMDEELKDEVALKFLPPETLRDDGALEDLRRETLRSRKLSHPNIVKTYEFLREGTFGAISMEFVDGCTLGKIRGQQEEGALPADFPGLKKWLLQLCEALAYAHETVKVAHRDLKPSNLMIDADGNLKVADFGIARSLTESQTRLSGAVRTIAGTLGYMSPQQLDGDSPSIADDVYSFGATVFELLTSKPPFYHGENIPGQIRTVVPPAMAQRRRELGVTADGAIPAAWEGLIARCLEKDTRKRPATFAEVREVLTASKLPARKPALKRRLALLAAVASVAIGGGIWWKVQQDTPSPSGETGPISHIGPISPIPPTEDPAAKAEKARQEKELADAKAKADAAEKAAAKLAEEKAALEEQQRQEAARRMAEEKKKAEEEAAKKNTPAARLAAATKDAPFENTLGMKFVPVPITGGPTGGQTVYFCMHETRVKDFQAFVAADKSFDYSKGEVPYTWTGTEFKQVPGKGWDNPGFTQDETHPVTCVSWKDAQAFITWLNKQEPGLTYRLPTDHEWSCAVGIGDRENAAASPESKHAKIEGVYPWGDSFPPPSGAGNYADSAAAAKFARFSSIVGYTDGFAGTAPVMSFPKGRSRDGLYDLGGNVWEWCAGCYDGSDPLGNDKTLTKSRGFRGGSLHDGCPADLRSSLRHRYAPGGRYYGYGFRLVLVGAGFGG